MNTLEILKKDIDLNKLKQDTIAEGNRRRLKPGLDRRQFSYAAYSPERRSGYDRRSDSFSVPHSS